jgi:hypothetical protein
MNIKHSVPSALIILFFLYSISGCSPHGVKPVDESIIKRIAPFVENGKTKKEEVVQKTDFYFSYKEYRTKKDTICIFRTFSSQDVMIYDLVLIFDENDVLKKNSLVKAW